MHNNKESTALDERGGGIFHVKLLTLRPYVLYVLRLSAVSGVSGSSLLVFSS